MPTYKVVLEVTCNYDEEALRDALERLSRIPESTFEGCDTFQASVLALAETQASRAGRDECRE